MDDLDFGVAVLGSVGIILVNENKGSSSSMGRRSSSSVVDHQLFPFLDSKLCLLLYVQITT